MPRVPPLFQRAHLHDELADEGAPVEVRLEQGTLVEEGLSRS